MEEGAKFGRAVGVIVKEVVVLVLKKSVDASLNIVFPDICA
jgi:hypothetical protein